MYLDRMPTLGSRNFAPDNAMNVCWILGAAERRGCLTRWSFTKFSAAQVDLDHVRLIGEVAHETQ